jgi:hypothetical protein|nr:MAG TPA: hypothetical protein [Caudoviricetes sp.]
MGETVIYLAHDPLSNTEAQVTEFDPALLNAAAAQGVVFVAVDAHGNRRIADVSEVKPPEGTEGSLQLVQPVYVDERMQAVVDVFDALQTLVLPEAAALAADDDQPAQVRDPVETFSAKLTALREITKAGESR